MFDIVYCEWLKLKHSKMIWMICLGSLICPILGLSLEYVNSAYFYTERVSDLAEIYGFAITFIMLLFGPIILSVAATYLITMEYMEKTWKTILVVPVSRIQVLIGKFLVLFFLLLLFLFLSWAEIFILALLGRFFFEISDVTVMTALFFLARMIKYGVLIYPVITPFVYLALRTKGGWIPFIVIVGASLVNTAFSNTSLEHCYPWLLPNYFMSVSIGWKKPEIGSIRIGILIMGAVCVMGIAGSIWRIWREDMN